MAITRSLIVDALDANLNEIWQDGLKSWPEEYAKVFNVENTDKAVVQDSYESGFGLVPVKNEGVAATYDTIIPGVKETYTIKTYALGYEITEEAIEDNQHTAETFTKLPQALNRSAIETVEVTAFNVFNNGYSSTGFDSSYLFATDHITLDGNTQANTPSTAADLSKTSLTAALIAIEGFTDERGLKQPTKAVTLLVPTALQFTAAELLESTYVPYSANNEINALTKKDISYMVGHYLTDSDQWQVLASKENHKLKFFWRVRPGALRRGTDFDSTNLKHLLRMRFECGYSHWMGTYGSSGA